MYWKNTIIFAASTKEKLLELQKETAESTWAELHGSPTVKFLLLQLLQVAPEADLAMDIGAATDMDMEPRTVLALG